MKHYYVALTIGPLYRTLGYARKTRELWAASYLFSFIMKNIIDAIDSNNNEENTNCHFDIILPTKINDTDYNSLNEVGLFPDRLIAKAEKRENNGVGEIHKEFIKIIKGANLIIERDYIANFVEIVEEGINQYTLAIELNENDNPLDKIYPMLDTMDQQTLFKTEYEEKSIRKYIESVKSTKLYSKLTKNNPEFRFRSIPEIATFSLSEDADKDAHTKIFKDDDEIQDVYKALKTKFNILGKPEKLVYSHKYMAVVQADGDSMGRLIKILFEYGGTEAIKILSGYLMSYGIYAAEEINNYGGMPIYLGGDDILFFAPLKTSEKKGSKNIFDLISNLDNLFEECISKRQLVFETINWWNNKASSDITIKPVSTPTLSFGCAISYHKYPLKEALISARSLLFETAKQVPGKNALSYRLLKHSGHYIGATVCKEWESWYAFKHLLSNESLNREFLSSVQYKLESLRPLFKRILCGRKNVYGNSKMFECIKTLIPDEFTTETLLFNISKQFFNEKEVHDKSRKYTEYVLALLLQIFRDMEDKYGNNQSTADMAIDSLYAYLRTMQFYNQTIGED